MASFKVKFPVLQEPFAKNLGPPAGRGLMFIFNKHAHNTDES